MIRNKTLLGTISGTVLIVATSLSTFGARITITGDNDYRAGLGGEFNIIAADAAGNALLGSTLARGYVTNPNGALPPADTGTTVGTANGTAMRVGTGTGNPNSASGNASYSGALGFETFCIEYNEHISLPGTYDVMSISLGAIYGGVAGGIDPDGNGPALRTDRISVGTAYLYNNFARGTLTGYDYANGSGRAADAVRLQNAIWFLEDEVSYATAGGASNPFLAQVLSVYTGTSTSLIGNAAGGAKVDNTIWNVAALNLGGVDPNQKQDQLILNDNHFHVPDGGATVMLLGLSLGGLALLRRKFA